MLYRGRRVTIIFAKLFNVLKEIMKEAGVYSINRVVPSGILALDITVFIGVTLYLLYLKETWEHYGEFTSAIIYIFVTCAVWITGNKITNSIYNTTPGGPGKPLNGVADKLMNTVADRVNSLNNTETNKSTENGDKNNAKLR